MSVNEVQKNKLRSAEKSKVVCYGCKKAIPASERTVQCEVCESNYHEACAKDIAKLKSGGLSRCCSATSRITLDRSLQHFAGEITSNLSTQLNDTSASIGKSISSLVKKVGEQDKRLVALENINIEQRLVELETRPAESAALNSVSPATIESILAEGRERERRSHHVVAFKLEEATDNQSDAQRISDLFAAIDPAIPLPRFVRRIGKISAEKIRPLLLVYSSTDEARKVLKFKEAVKLKGIDLKNDLTRGQLQHLKDLRNELEKKVNDGNTDLTIKYIRGTPAIVSKNESPLGGRHEGNLSMTSQLINAMTTDGGRSSLDVNTTT